jgi:hypothetical protein
MSNPVVLITGALTGIGDNQDPEGRGQVASGGNRRISGLVTA